MGQVDNSLYYLPGCYYRASFTYKIFLILKNFYYETKHG
jgi:hypothetical protein